VPLARTLVAGFVVLNVALIVLIHHLTDP